MSLRDSRDKSREISFAQNVFLSRWTILKFYADHGSDTIVLSAKFWNDWTIASDSRLDDMPPDTLNLPTIEFQVRWDFHFVLIKF